MMTGNEDELRTDAKKIVGALIAHHELIEDDAPLPEAKIRDVFCWGEYLDECLDYLVETYDEVERVDGGYVLTDIPDGAPGVSNRDE